MDISSPQIVIFNEVNGKYKENSFKVIQRDIFAGLKEVE